MRLADLCCLYVIPLATLSTISCAEEPSARDLWTALQHATGFTDDELHHLAKELHELPAPSQKSLWQKKVHCTKGYCAPEATSRLVAALGEVGQLPSRHFELFPGDPLYDYWKESDKTKFHSWVDGSAAEETIEGLIPEGQPLASGRIQASSFTWRAKALIEKLGPEEAYHSLGRCLEWDTPFYVIKAFNEFCYRSDILQYANAEAGMEERMKVYPKGTRHGPFETKTPQKSHHAFMWETWMDIYSKKKQPCRRIELFVFLSFHGCLSGSSQWTCYVRLIGCQMIMDWIRP